MDERDRLRRWIDQCEQRLRRIRASRFQSGADRRYAQSLEQSIVENRRRLMRIDASRAAPTGGRGPR